MITRKRIRTAGVIFSIFAILAVIFSNQNNNQDNTVKIGDRQWVVELVSSPDARERGLGSRENPPPYHGMLFLFPDIEAGRHSFWMKGMRFPLDIAWIRDGRVIFIQRNIPADSPEVYRPESDADSVLEVNAGELSDVMVGDMIDRY